MPRGHLPKRRQRRWGTPTESVALPRGSRSGLPLGLRGVFSRHSRFMSSRRAPQSSRQLARSVPHVRSCPLPPQPEARPAQMHVCALALAQCQVSSVCICSDSQRTEGCRQPAATSLGNDLLAEIWARHARTTQEPSSLAEGALQAFRSSAPRDSGCRFVRHATMTCSSRRPTGSARRVVIVRTPQSGSAMGGALPRHAFRTCRRRRHLARRHPAAALRSLLRYRSSTTGAWSFAE